MERQQRVRSGAATLSLARLVPPSALLPDTPPSLPASCSPLRRSQDWPGGGASNAAAANRGKRCRGVSQSSALGRPRSAPGSRAGLPSGRKRSGSGCLRLPEPTPPRPSSGVSYSASHFPSRPAPPPAPRRPRPGAPLPSSPRAGSADLICGARAPEPRGSARASPGPQPVNPCVTLPVSAPPGLALAPLRVFGLFRVSLWTPCPAHCLGN